MAEARPLPLPPFSTKSLSVSIDAPPSEGYLPGDTVSLSLVPIAPATLSSFVAITLRLAGTSFVNDGSLLPSAHTILNDTQEVDLSQEDPHLKVEFLLPAKVACSCREPRCWLPPSGKIVLSHSEVMSTLMVGYRIEVTVKRKGWTKSVERRVSRSLVDRFPTADTSL